MREVNIFTNSFPYGKSEQFLYEELVVLSKTFDKINLFPAKFSEKTITWDLPKNIFIYHFENKIEVVPTKKNILLLLKAFISELKHGKYFGRYLSKPRYYTAHLSNANTQSENLLAFLKRSNIDLNSLFYTYWFDDWTYKLAILKEKNKIKYLITRIHGGDVYEYQHVEKDFFFPFRNFQISFIDKIFPISQDGSDHLKINYPSSVSKLKLSHLATRDYGLNPVKTTKEEFTLVSCSTFYHYKNVGLIPKILAQLKFPVKWIHIGDDGPEKEQVIKSSKQLPSTIKTEFKGHLTQKEIFDFYRTNYIDLFINVSKSEGIPVSLMEAISFGIPVMAPNVGGIKEITNSKTGILFTIDTTAEKLAEKVTSVKNGATTFERKEIREFWEENFRSEKNYASFSEELKLINA